MYDVFSKTCIGYAHTRSGKPCQDHSSFYQDKDFIAITCCDGHGGDIYVRSGLGSKYASSSLLKVFSSLTPSSFRGKSIKGLEDKIRLDVLCEWNKRVEQSYSRNPIRKKELEGLDEEKKGVLRLYPVKAYGTTLSGAALFGHRLVVISIGDGEVLLAKKGIIEKVFDTDSDPVANVTYSMCQEDAYRYIRVKIIDFRGYDGIFLCTDGLSSPYQSYQNLTDSLIRPLIRRTIERNNHDYIDSFVDELALKKGVGDDVSLAYIIDTKAKLRYYK